MNEKEFIQFLQNSDSGELIRGLPNFQMQAWKNILAGSVSDILKKYSEEKGIQFTGKPRENPVFGGGYFNGTYFYLIFCNPKWKNGLRVLFCVAGTNPGGFGITNDYEQLMESIEIGRSVGTYFIDCLPRLGVYYGVVSGNSLDEDFRSKILNALETRIEPSDKENKTLSQFLWGKLKDMITLYEDDYADFVDFVKNTVDQISAIVDEVASED